jgi:hypothetical protein
MTIVKVQKPVFTKMNGCPYFVYAEGHQDPHFMLWEELPPNVQKAMGVSLKGYFEAELVDGVWKLGKHVEPQEW